MNQKSLAIAVALAAAALVSTLASTPLAFAGGDEGGQDSETDTSLKGKCKDNQSGQGNIQACVPINVFIPPSLLTRAP